MPTYILKIGNSDCTTGEEFNKDLSTGTEAADSISVNVTAAGSPDHGHAYTLVGVPNNADWETGVITIEVNVTTADMNMSLGIAIARVESSGCVFIETSAAAPAQTLGSTGVHTYTTPSKNWAPGDASDRLRVLFNFSTSAHGGADVVIETGTTDCEIVTVITEGAPPVSRRIFIGD